MADIIPVLLQVGRLRWRIPGEKDSTSILIVAEYNKPNQWPGKRDLVTVQRDKQLTLETALRHFLMQFVDIDLDLWIRPTFTERILGNASRRQMMILRDLEESKEEVSDLFTEKTVIALALHCLFLLQEMSMLETGQPPLTEEEIFKDGGPVEFFDTDDPSKPGTPLPNVTLDRQENWVKPSSGKGCPDNVRLPNVLAHISRLSLSLLDTQDPRNWPTVLHVLLLLSRIRRALYPTQPWMKKLRVAGNAITPLFEDVARYFYVCTDGGFVLSPRWDEEKYAVLVGRCRASVKQGAILRRLWARNCKFPPLWMSYTDILDAPVQIAEWDSYEKYRGMDGFANKVDFFSNGSDWHEVAQ